MPNQADCPITADLVFGEFAFKCSQLALFRGKRNVGLRPKTARVLALLLVNRGRIVTKIELLAEVWQDAIVTEDSLFQCIRELRSVLGSQPKNDPYIKTLPKHGYMWVWSDVVESKPVSKNRGKPWNLILAVMAILSALGGLFLLNRGRANSVQRSVQNKTVSLFLLPCVMVDAAPSDDWVPFGLTPILANQLECNPQVTALHGDRVPIEFMPSNLNSGGTIAESAVLEMNLRFGCDMVVTTTVVRSRSAIQLTSVIYTTAGYSIELVATGSSLGLALANWRTKLYESVGCQPLRQQDLGSSIGDGWIAPLGRGIQAMKMGRYREGLDCFTQIHLQNADWAPARMARANAYLKLGDLGSGTTELDAIEPDLLESATAVDYWRLRAQMDEAKGAREARRISYFQLFRLGLSRESGLIMAQALSSLGEASFEDAQFHLAQHYWFQALHYATEIGYKPAQAQLRIQLGSCLSVQGLEDEAYREYQAALSISLDLGVPRISAHCQAHLGGLADRQGQAKVAMDHFETARRLYASLNDREGSENCARRLRLIASLN